MKMETTGNKPLSAAGLAAALDVAGGGLGDR